LTLAIVISDTSPIRALAQLNRMDLLPSLFDQVLVPPAVDAELRSPPGQLPFVDVRQLAFARIQAPSDRKRVGELERVLDPGESEALALAIELGVRTILIDEAAGRSMAKRLGLSPIGRRALMGESRTNKDDFRVPMILMNIKVQFEQAVYGSFPFWQRGYGVLARSSGCRPAWIAALKTACQRYGERPSGTIEADGLFAMRPDHGPWMIVGVYPQGYDDQGRPGALAFHALFVGRWTYARAGADPFVFSDLLHRDWSRADLDATLPNGRSSIRRSGFRRSFGPISPVDERFEPIVTAIAQGRRVAVQSAEPIDALARGVWRALPMRVRLRASVATWAFDNANRFDLVALPKLTAIGRETTDLILATGDPGR
jgi:predicted nucleic acid-binding protein